MKALNVNPKITGLTVGVDLPKFYEVVGRDAEFVYGPPRGCRTRRASGGRIDPDRAAVSRGAGVVESYKKEFPGADLSFYSANGYGGCQILIEAIRRVGSLDSGKAPRGHAEDGLQHRLRRIPGRSGPAPDRAQVFDFPVAGRQESHRLARGAGAGQGALPDPAVESASVSKAGKVFAVVVLVGLAWAVRRAPRRSRRSGSAGRSAQTGAYAALGQDQLHGYQLCVKHMNEKGGVLRAEARAGRLRRRVGSRPRPSVSMKSSSRRTRWIWFSVRTPRLSPTPWPSVTEKHKMPMVAPSASRHLHLQEGAEVHLHDGSSLRRSYLEGLIDLAAKKGLKTVALINGDERLFDGRSHRAPSSWPRRRGFRWSSPRPTPQGNTDFSAILTKVRAANPDVLGGATSASMTR